MGKLSVTGIFDEETGTIKPQNDPPIIVELLTKRRPFYGDVTEVANPIWGTRRMLSANIRFELQAILISGPVLVSSNYSIYQEWEFEPALT